MRCRHWQGEGHKCEILLGTCFLDHQQTTYVLSYPICCFIFDLHAGLARTDHLANFLRAPLIYQIVFFSGLTQTRLITLR